jgi:hypothetical protein
MNVRVDLAFEAAIPGDDDVTGVGDRLDDSAVADDEIGRAVLDAHKLDPGTHANTRTYASREKTGAVRIHVSCIGRSGRRLDGR